MKSFKNVSEWLKSNPSDEEMKKVINLINKGAVSQARKEYYDLAGYYRKLSSGANHMKKLGLATPEEITKRMKETKVKMDELSKGLPAIQKRAKKEAVKA